MPDSAEMHPAAETQAAVETQGPEDATPGDDARAVSFHDLDLAEPLLRAVKDEGYEEPTPIQARVIPHLLEGRDLMGRAQTGSGKTAAFALPIIQRLSGVGKPQRGRARVLVLTPTRELAVQIDDSFRVYGRHVKLSRALVYGGVSQVPQVKALKRGVDVLVATPGRLLDLIGQRHVRLDSVEVFVLDEADRMLDMGFIPDIHRIVAMLPKERQSLFFSATMPPAAMQLANDMTSEPVVVNLAPKHSTAENIDQKVMLVEQGNKRSLLCKLLEDPGIARALVFTRTKHRADSVAKCLKRAGVSAEAIHGDRAQAARQKALDRFRAGRTRVLVATDVAARGIDVDGITHVFNFEMPVEPEVYIHRIGRTARAGAAGIAYSFCDVAERSLLYEIEKLIKRPIDIAEEHPFRSTVPYVRAGGANSRMRMRKGRAPRSLSRGIRRTHI
ncbi:MAG: DEAD/DEAH box helicase [Planctomycetota bacterium]